MSDLRGWRVRRRMRMPPARVIAGPRALLTSILVVVTRVPFRSGAGRANPRIQITPGAGSSFRGSTGTFCHTSQLDQELKRATASHPSDEWRRRVGGPQWFQLTRHAMWNDMSLGTILDDLEHPAWAK